MSESDQSRTFDQSASEGASSSPPYEANQTAPEAGHDASWSAPGSGSASSASQFDSTATGGASGHAGAYRPGSDSREGPDSSWGAPPPRWGQRTSFAPPANGSDQFATPGQPASQASAEWSHASDHSARRGWRRVSYRDPNRSESTGRGGHGVGFRLADDETCR